MEGSVADSLRELEQNMRFCCDRVTRMKEYGYSEDVWGTTVTELDKYVPRIQAMRELVSIKVTEHHAKSK